MDRYYNAIDYGPGGSGEDLPLPQVPSGKKWIADPFNSEIIFSIKHLQLMEIKGSVKKFSVTAFGTPPDFRDLSVSVEIFPETLDTGNAEQDLEVVKLFQVPKFPTIRFKSDEVEWKQFNEFLLYGELTIKGITQPMTLEGKLEDFSEEDPMGLPRAKFSIEGDLNRKLFKLMWENENVVKVLSNNVHLKGTVEIAPPKLLDVYKKMNIPVK